MYFVKIGGKCVIPGPGVSSSMIAEIKAAMEYRDIEKELGHTESAQQAQKDIDAMDALLHSLIRAHAAEGCSRIWTIKATTPEELEEMAKKPELEKAEQRRQMECKIEKLLEMLQADSCLFNDYAGNGLRVIHHGVPGVAVQLDAGAVDALIDYYSRELYLL